MEIVLIGAFYIGVMLYLVNIQTLENKQYPFLRPMLAVVPIVLVFFGMFFFMISTQPIEAQEALASSSISPSTGLTSLGISIAAAVLSFLVMESVQVRQLVQQFIGKSGRYDPDNFMHTVALVLAVCVLSWLVMNFILLGGISGLAESLDSEPPTINESMFDAILNVLLALLGIGLFIRRTPQEALSRLKLRIPTLDDVKMGIGAGIVLYIFSTIAMNFLTVILNPEVLEAQSAASEQIATAFSGTLVSGFILALAAGIGEEILFRGALQPVFGIPLTTFYFIVLHQQYLLTPIMIVLFGVGLGLALLRDRYSTTTAIIAHSVYNFIPFLLINLLTLLGSS